MMTSHAHQEGLPCIMKLHTPGVHQNASFVHQKQEVSPGASQSGAFGLPVGTVQLVTVHCLSVPPGAGGELGG